MKSIKYLLIFLLFSYTVSAQQKVSLVGKQSPPVIFQKVLGKSVPPNFYAGKILVLDFWATWCAPCIAGFPEFNKLSKKYSAKDVLFASITDEPEIITDKFFKRTKKELDVIKLIDTSKNTMEGFNIQYLPSCVVIDKNNVVKWVGLTYELTDAIMSSIINGKDVASQNVITVLKPENKRIVDRALFSFSVAKADTLKRTVEGGNSSSSYSNYLSLDIVNSSLGDCLEQLTGYSKVARIVSNDSLRMKQLIDIDFTGGEDTLLFNRYNNVILKGQGRRNLIISLLGQALKFDVKPDRKKVKHYELVVTDTAKLHAFKSMQKNHSSFDADHFPRFEIVRYKLKNIAVELEGSMKTVITCNIKDEDGYDLSLDISNIETANKDLKLHGLQLKEVNDEIDYLQVSFY